MSCLQNSYFPNNLLKYSFQTLLHKNWTGLEGFIQKIIHHWYKIMYMTSLDMKILNYWNFSVFVEWKMKSYAMKGLWPATSLKNFFYPPYTQKAFGYFPNIFEKCFFIFLLPSKFTLTSNFSVNFFFTILSNESFSTFYFIYLLTKYNKTIYFRMYGSEFVCMP